MALGGLQAVFFFETPAGAAVKAAAPLIGRAVSLAAGTAGRGKSASFIFTGDEGIKNLNRRFLKRRGLTDVIAFNCPSLPGISKAEELGDVYICLPQARRQAAEMGHSLITELLILAVHGTLHLTGMDDSDKDLRREMNQKTARILKKLAAESCAKRSVKGYRRE